MNELGPWNQPPYGQNGLFPTWPLALRFLATEFLASSSHCRSYAFPLVHDLLLLLPLSLFYQSCSFSSLFPHLLHLFPLIISRFFTISYLMVLFFLVLILGILFPFLPFFFLPFPTTVLFTFFFSLTPLFFSFLLFFLPFLLITVCFSSYSYHFVLNVLFFLIFSFFALRIAFFFILFLSLLLLFSSVSSHFSGVPFVLMLPSSVSSVLSFCSFAHCSCFFICPLTALFSFVYLLIVLLFFTSYSSFYFSLFLRSIRSAYVFQFEHALSPTHRLASYFPDLPSSLFFLLFFVFKSCFFLTSSSRLHSALFLV